jgi:hypothetical protein
MTYAEWKTATIKLLEDPKARNVREKVWKDAYIGRLTPKQAAAVIGAEYRNKMMSPAARKRRNLRE